MHYRKITKEDLSMYLSDIISCYQTNTLVFDSQNYLKDTDMEWFIDTYIEAPDSLVTGIFDDKEEFLYGLVIFDNIRMADKASAQVHIVNDKSIFGKKVRDIYKHIIETCGFDVLYAEIPSIAVHAIGMCKRLGFKKTGYIPEALPYVNSKGVEQMYDIQIWSLIKK